MATTVTRPVARAARRVAAGPVRETGDKYWIYLRNVPRTAVPADIKRACAKVNVDNVESAAINYYRFLPDGKAFIKLKSPNFTAGSVQALKNTVVGGLHIRAYPSVPPESIRPPRNRGVRGRAEAAERGLVSGDGPDGGVTGSGKNVVIWGLPGKLTPDALKEYLKGFKLAGSEGGAKEIVKLDVAPLSRIALSSRHFVRTASVSEAHRLVRTLHMTFFRPDAYNTKYSIRARVVY